MNNKYQILPILIALLSIVMTGHAYYTSFIIDLFSPTIGITSMVLFGSIAVAFICIYINERRENRNNQSNK
jgi:hypothetical protein